MNQSTWMGLFIVVIMAMSTIGYAIISAVPQQGIIKEAPVFPTLMDRPLQPEEKVYILRTGRIVVEYAYDKTSEANLTARSILEMFFRPLGSYAVVAVYPANFTNQTFAKITGMGGGMKNIESFEEANLTALFCKMTIKQPHECIIMEFPENAVLPSQAGNATEGNHTESPGTENYEPENLTENLAAEPENVSGNATQ